MFPFINKFFFKVLLGELVALGLCFASIKFMKYIDQRFWESVAQWTIITLGAMMFTANARLHRKKD